MVESVYRVLTTYPDRIQSGLLCPSSDIPLHQPLTQWSEYLIFTGHRRLCVAVHKSRFGIHEGCGRIPD
jgi:hypothetical protein